MDALRPGARVRLSLKADPVRFERQRVLGLLVGFEGDTMLVSHQPGGPGRAVPLDKVETFEVSTGRKSSAGKGALIGLAGGAAAGVGAALIVCDDDECVGSGYGSYKGLVAGVFGVGGALFGAGVGALVGGRFHGDRWERIPLEELRMGMEPIGHGGRLRMTLHFR